ncbi:MAG: AAA family ATPase [Pseudomonadota bacterium]
MRAAPGAPLLTIVALLAIAGAHDASTAGSPDSRRDAAPEQRDAWAPEAASPSPAPAVESGDAAVEDRHPAGRGDPVPATQPTAEPVVAPASPASPQDLLIARLRSLLDGSLDHDVDPRSLFAVDLSDLAAVRSRIGELATLLRESELAQQDLERQLASARAESVQLPPPPALVQAPVAPAPPPPVELGAAPPAPTKPPFKRSRRTTAARREAWSAYDQAVIEHQKAIETFKARQQQVAETQAAYERSRAEYASAIAAHEKAKADHLEQQAQARASKALRVVELERRVIESKSRLQTTQLRHRYLVALGEKLDVVGAPAQRGFVALGEPRTALRTERERVAELTRALRRLAARAATLDARASGGALVGFMVDRERFLEASTVVREQLEAAIAASSVLERALAQAAQDLETEGRALQTLILRTLALVGGSPELDDAFLLHMREMRRQRRGLSAQGEGGSGVDLRALTTRLDQVLLDPTSVPSFTEAEQALASVGERQVEVMTLSEGRNVAVGRWRLAFERQVNATLEPLASDKARKEAYALSVALLTELQDEVLELASQLASWGRGRLGDLWDVLSFASPAASWGWLGRLALLILVVGGTMWGRRFVPGSVSWLVKQVSRLRALRGRMGTVVRWAGLLQALAPTLLYVVSGELVLTILGTRHVEVQILSILWHWAVLFWLGRQALIGLTRRVSRGRPALIDVREGTLSLLRLTYDRLILMLVVTAAANDIVDAWLGSGQLRTLIDMVIIAGLGVWLVWACLGWRELLARSWQQALEDTHRLQGAISWMSRDRRGAILSPVALVWLVVGAASRVALRLSERGGLSTFLRARELKRMAKKAGSEVEAQLPEKYRSEFPLYPILGEEDAAVLRRDEVLAPILEQIAHWRGTNAGGSVVLVGEKGIGKSTLCGMLRRSLVDTEVLFHTLHTKVLDPASLANNLAPALGADDAHSIEDIAHFLQSGPERVVIVDDAHNLFLRIVDGYRAFDALVQLVNQTSERVFWVLVFNRFAWQFINQSRKREHYFRRIIELPRWSANELQELINTRNRRSGFTIRFSEMLLDDETGPSDQFQLIEGAEGFFRLLWDQSRGNPRIATHLWLSALHPTDDSTLEVGLFRTADAGAFDLLGDELWFALAAICQHENLAAPELQSTLAVSMDFAGFAVRILREYGFVEAKRTGHDRVTLSPRYYRQVLDRLRSKHLLFEV